MAPLLEPELEPELFGLPQNRFTMNCQSGSESVLVPAGVQVVSAVKPWQADVLCSVWQVPPVPSAVVRHEVYAVEEQAPQAY